MLIGNGHRQQLCPLGGDPQGAVHDLPRPGCDRFDADVVKRPHRRCNPELAEWFCRRDLLGFTRQQISGRRPNQPFQNQGMDALGHQASGRSAPIGIGQRPQPGPQGRRQPFHAGQPVLRQINPDLMDGRIIRRG